MQTPPPPHQRGRGAASRAPQRAGGKAKLRYRYLLANGTALGPPPLRTGPLPSSPLTILQAHGCGSSMWTQTPPCAGFTTTTMLPRLQVFPRRRGGSRSPGRMERRLKRWRQAALCGLSGHRRRRWSSMALFTLAVRLPSHRSPSSSRKDQLALLQLPETRMVPGFSKASCSLQARLTSTRDSPGSAPPPAPLIPKPSPDASMDPSLSFPPPFCTRVMQGTMHRGCLTYPIA